MFIVSIFIGNLTRIKQSKKAAINLKKKNIIMI